jgi:hypothetical protein
MATQQNVTQYAQAIQAQLTSIVSPIPVYSNFNRNYATEPKFITWHLRNVHQPVYTGVNQNNKGIDRPIFQISVFSVYMNDGLDIANTVIQALHGYNGLFGGATYGFQISKADVQFLYHGYDNTTAIHQVFMDCTLDIPT